MPQIELGSPARTFDHDQIELIGEGLVAPDDLGPCLGAISLMLSRLHVKARPSTDHDLASRLTLRLQQHGIHVDVWLQATRLCLHRLRTADLTASRADRGIVRHVLRLEGRHTDTVTREGAAQRGHDDTFADVRRGSHYHQGLGVHQNSIPLCADTPSRYGCFTTCISVTMSAIALSSGGAARPVSITWRSGRRCFSPESTSLS